MSIGRYYLRRASMSRPSIAFATWSSAIRPRPTSPEALHRLTEAYLALGLQQEAQKNAAVLGYNFPGQPVVYGQLRPVERWDKPVSRWAARPRRGPRARHLTRRVMLISLAIRDIILIERLDLEFERGLCAL